MATPAQKPDLGRKFRRQEPIGPYIVDFACFDPMLVIEIDGSQHAGSIAHDAERSAYLERRGFKVIRFWNHEVLARTDWVREAISPPPNPLPSGGGILAPGWGEVASLHPGHGGSSLRPWLVQAVE